MLCPFGFLASKELKDKLKKGGTEVSPSGTTPNSLPTPTVAQLSPPFSYACHANDFLFPQKFYKVSQASASSLPLRSTALPCFSAAPSRVGQVQVCTKSKIWSDARVLSESTSLEIWPAHIFSSTVTLTLISVLGFLAVQCHCDTFISHRRMLHIYRVHDGPRDQV